MTEKKEIQFLMYQINNEKVNVKAILKDETIWLTQKGMAELFDVSIPTINEHLKNIYESKELDKESTIRNFRIVQTEGNRQVARDIDFYNLDAIISVGYRVNSTKATQFRIWATNTLKEYMIKGFVIY
ncbi:MAG: virulence RhuM family protein, partial [Clostridia bacterium]|nr:virulence RhuM family protein [Clostridia bacterium]